MGTIILNGLVALLAITSTFFNGRAYAEMTPSDICTNAVTTEADRRQCEGAVRMAKMVRYCERESMIFNKNFDGCIADSYEKIAFYGSAESIGAYNVALDAAPNSQKLVQMHCSADKKCKC